MRVLGADYKIAGVSVSLERGIEWREMNNRIESINDSDSHLSSRLSVWGSEPAIFNLNRSLSAGGSYPFEFAGGENPFGPAFDCAGTAEYKIKSAGDAKTDSKGVAETSVEIIQEWSSIRWAYPFIPLDLSNFAVQSVSRENAESGAAERKMGGWHLSRHGYRIPRLSLSLMGRAAQMGGTIRYVCEMEGLPYPLACGDSMNLIDGREEASLVCTGFGGLKNFGNSGWWECDFEFARVS